MFFGDEANMFLKDNKKPNIPLRQHYSHQEKKYQKFKINNYFIYIKFEKNYALYWHL